jgi:hypothetical protein
VSPADANQFGFNADTILRTIPVLLATAGAMYKFKDARPRRRTMLKNDLDLLKAARDQNIACEDFEASIETELSRLYRSTAEREWPTIVFGSLIALSFGVWTAYLISEGSTWWALGTGFFTFIGISLVMAGLESRPALEGRTRQARFAAAHPDPQAPR